MTLPAGWTIRSVTCNGGPVDWRPLPVEAGIQHVRLNLPRAVPGGHPASADRRLWTIVAEQPLELAEDPLEPTDWSLPVVGFANCRLIRGRIFVRTRDDEFEISAVGVKGLKAIPVVHPDDRLGFGLLCRPGTVRGMAATIRMLNKTSRLSAEVLSSIRLHPRRQRSRHEVLLDPNGGSFRSVDVLLPDCVGTGFPVHWFGPEAAIVERTSRNAGGGFRQWTLRFDRPVRQRGRLLLELASARSSGGKPVAVHRVVLPAAARQTGITVVHAGNRQRLTVAARSAGKGRTGEIPLEPASAAAVKRVTGFFGNGGRIAAAFHEPHRDCEITLTETRLESGAALPAVCPRMGLNSVVTESGSIHNRVVCNLSAAGARTLRVRLPEGGRLWSVLCDGQPVDVRRDGGSFLVLLRAERRSRCQLVIVYAARFEPATTFGRLRQAPPILSVQTFDGTETPLLVGRRDWSLHHPPDMAVVESRGRFQSTQSLDRAGWLIEVRRLTSSDTFRWSIALALIGGLVFLGREAARRRLDARRLMRVFVMLTVGLLLVAAVSPTGDDTPNTGDSRADPVEVSAGLSLPTAGGALSAPVPIEPPRGFAAKRFRYLGGDDGAALDISYQMRAGSSALRLCVALGVFALFWLLRTRGRGWKGGALFAGLVVPAALVLWCPLNWHAFLDGAFLGTVCGGTLWAGRRWAGRRATLGRPALPNGRRPDAETRGISSAIAATTLCGIFLSGTASAAKPVVPSSRAAAGGFVSGASYVVELRPGNAVVSARFHLNAATSRPTPIVLPLGRVAIQSATIDGKPAALSWRPGRDAKLQPVLIVANADGKTLHVRLSLPISKRGNTRRFTLPVRPVAAGRAVLHLDNSGSNVAFRGLHGASVVRKNGGKPTVTFPVDDCRDVTVVLTGDAARSPAFPKSRASTSDTSEAAAVRFTSADSGVEFNDGGVFQQDRLAMTVVDGSIRRWEFALPTEVKLLNVSGRDVAGWSLGPPRDAGRVVRVDFRRAISDATELQFRLFRTSEISEEPQELGISFVSPMNAVTPPRQLGVAAVGSIELQLTPGKGILPMPGARKTPGFWKSRASCRIVDPTSRPVLKVWRPSPQTHVKAEHAVIVDADEVRIATRLTIDFGGSPRSGVALVLPEGFTLHGLKGDRGAEWAFGEAESTGAVVFPRPVAGVVRIVLHGQLPRDASKPELELALPGPMSAGRIQIVAGVWQAEGLRVKIDNSDGWQPLRGTDRPQAILKRNRGEPVGVFRTDSEEPTPIAVSVAPRKSRVQAETLTLMTVRDGGVHYTLFARCSGLSGVSRTVALSVPRWLGEQLNFRGDPGLLVQRVLPGAESDERIRWTISRLDRRSEALFIIAHAVLPPPGVRGRSIAAPVVEWQQLAHGERPGNVQAATFADVTHSRQSVVLVNESRHRLVRPRSSQHRPAAARDLCETIAVPSSFHAFAARAVDRLRVNPQAGEPHWTVKRLATRRGIAAAVKRAELTTLLEIDGTWRMQAAYRIRNRGRRFFAVTLPTGARLLSATVNGRDAAGGNETHGKSYRRLIPLRIGKDSIVRLILAGRLSGDFQRAALPVEFPAPTVVSFAEDRTLGMPVEQTVWTVHLAGGLTGKAHSKRSNLRRAAAGARRSPDRIARPPTERRSPLPVDNLQLRNALIRANAAAERPASRDAVRWRFPLTEEPPVATVSATATDDAPPPTPPNTAPRITLRPPPKFDADSESLPLPPDDTSAMPALETRGPEFDFPIPDDVQTLSFEKAGGAPRLTLAVRATDADPVGGRILWTLAWIALGSGVVCVLRRRATPSRPR
ncbi:MAG: hypothetical protein ACE5KM_10675 [Planctomycetaceae bacterium]